MKTSPTAQVAAAIIAVFTLAIPDKAANAQVINFQFRQDGNGASMEFTGLGAAPDAGTFWNQVNFTSVSNTSIAYSLPGTILNSDGITASASTISSFTPSGSVVGIFSQVPNGVHPTTELMNTFLLTIGSGQISMTIGGLTPGGSYDLYLYSQNSRDYSDVANFTALGSGDTVTVDNRGMQGNPSTPFVYQQAIGTTAPDNNGNYGILFSQVADGSGNLAIDMVQADFEGAFNGFQIVTVPEPGTFVLLLSGAMGLLVCKLKRIRRVAA